VERIVKVPRVRVDHVEKVIEAQPNLVWDQQRKGLNQQAWVYNWLNAAITFFSGTSLDIYP
jgi:hypothetical protein